MRFIFSAIFALFLTAGYSQSDCLIVIPTRGTDSVVINTNQILYAVQAPSGSTANIVIADFSNVQTRITLDSLISLLPDLIKFTDSQNNYPTGINKQQIREIKRSSTNKAVIFVEWNKQLRYTSTQSYSSIRSLADACNSALSTTTILTNDQYFTSNDIEIIGDSTTRADASSCINIGGDTLLLMYNFFPLLTGDFDPFKLRKKYSYDRGRTWSSGEDVFSSVPLPEIIKGYGIPSLYEKNDTIHLIFWGGRHYAGDPGHDYYDAGTYYSRSLNKGVTWTTPVNIETPGDTTYHANAGDRLIEFEGDLLFVTGVLQNSTPTSAAGNYTVHLFRSSDRGNTWTQTNTGVTSPSLLAAEPGLFVKNDTVLVCYMRTRDKYVYFSESLNGGVTWGTPYQSTLRTGNTYVSIKNVGQKYIAVYSPQIQNSLGVSETSSLYERKQVAITSSVDLLAWSDPVFVHIGNSTEPVSIEPNLFISEPDIHVFHSPSDEGLANYGLRQNIIPLLALPSGVSKSVGRIEAKQVKIGDSVPGQTEPLHVKYDATTSGGSPFSGSYGAIFGDSQNGIFIGDASSGSSVTNEIRFINSLTSGGVNRINAINNSVSSSIPALRILVSKTPSVNLASGDIAFEINSAGNGCFRVFENGDVTCQGSFSPASFGTIRPSGVIYPLRGQGLRFNATLNTNATADAGLYQVGNKLKITDYLTGTKGIEVDMTNGLVGWANATTATAFLTLKASTTSAASVRVPTGAGPTSPNEGDIWQVSNDLHFYTNSTDAILARVLKGSATLDFGSTSAGAVTDLTITVTGAIDGDVVSLSVPNASQTTTGSFSAWVSATNTVTVRYRISALVGSEDPASGVFKVTVTK